jgi:hypothetical protein
MKKLLFLLVFIPLVSFGQQSFNNDLGDYVYFYNHPKAKGLDFKIKSLVGFDNFETYSTNIVQQWRFRYKSNYDNPVFIVIIGKDEFYKASEKNDFAEEFYNEIINDWGSNLPKEYKVSNIKKYSVNGFPGLMCDFYVGEKYDFFQTDSKEKNVFITQIVFFLQDYGVTIQLSSTVSEANRDNYKNLLEEFAKSFEIVKNEE